MFVASRFLLEKAAQVIAFTSNLDIIARQLKARVGGCDYCTKVNENGGVEIE
jgi:hypothetical protein